MKFDMKKVDVAVTAIGFVFALLNLIVSLLEEEAE